MTLKVYVAAPLAHASDAEDLALRIRACGEDVVSRWHLVVGRSAQESDDSAVRSCALAMNMADMEAADCCIALCAKGTPRSTFVEVGWMLGRGKPVAWFVAPGAPPPLMADHPLVFQASSETQLRDVLFALWVKRAAGMPRPPPSDPSVDEPSRGDGLIVVEEVE